MPSWCLLPPGCFFRVRGEGWRLGPVWASAAMAASSLCVVASSALLRWEREGERVGWGDWCPDGDGGVAREGGGGLGPERG